MALEVGSRRGVYEVSALVGEGGMPAPGPTRVSVNVEPRQHLSGSFGLEVRLGLQRPSRRSLVLSPDGRHLVYVASDGDTTGLYRRRMDQSQATLIPETEGAASPFFAPDGESVGFIVALPTASPETMDTQLKRMSLDSGEVRTIATSGPAFVEHGPSWTTHETILLPSGGAIYEVPANGGSLSRVTTFESTQGERLLYPQLLPGGQAVLYNVALGEVPSEWDIVVESLDTGERRVVVEGGSDPRYVSTGHIVFVRTGSLMAVPFDVQRPEMTGAPVVVVEDVMQAERAVNGNLNTGTGQFTVSRSGSLAYVPGGVYPLAQDSLVWVDHNGVSERVPVPPGRYVHPRVSPDGTRLAYAEGPRGNKQVWVYDIGLEVPVRLTTAGENAAVVWSPDSARLVVMSAVEGGAYRLLLMAADGSGEPRRLMESDTLLTASSWSADGVLAVVQGARDIWTVSMRDGSKPRPFLETPFTDRWPEFSPDGRWLAYGSDETGRFEVYVRPFPAGEPVYRVSTAGGISPLWSPDGQRLFFRPFDESTRLGAGIMVVDVTTGGTFTRTQPRLLLERQDLGIATPIRGYDLAPDDQRFVMVSSPTPEQQPVTSVRIVLNWTQELLERVPIP